MDHNKVTEFLGQFVTDLGATEAAGLVVVGHRLGLYRALAEGSATPEEFAERTGCHPRYLAEWLRGQAAGGYANYDPATGRFFMTEEQVFCLADPNGPNIPAAFLLALGMLRAEPQITEAFRTGDGFAWHRHHEDVFTGCDAFYRPGYVASLVSNWIPALDGVDAKLTAGAKVADIGCGLGSSSILLAEAYPHVTVAASDYHGESIDMARKQATEAGVGDRVSFEVATAQTFSGSGYDLVMMFDCLHDMGDPLSAAKHIRETLSPDGTWLLVEPFAGDKVEDNLTPVGRAYYSGSTFLCLPNALSQPGGYAMGAQGGEKAVRQVADEAGFTRFRRVTETPFNLVYEIRP